LDMMNDAAGNALGQLAAKFTYWVVIGLIVMVQPYYPDVQYGLKAPFLTFMALLLTIAFLMKILAYTRIKVTPYIQKVPFYWVIKEVGNTFDTFYVAWLALYLIRQAQWQTFARDKDKFQQFCNVGLTAFTDTWPEATHDLIWNDTTLCYLGLAFMVFDFLVVIITASEFQQNQHEERSKLMQRASKTLKEHSEGDAEVHAEVQLRLEETAWICTINGLSTKAFSIVMGLTVELLINKTIAYIGSCASSAQINSYANKEECEARTLLDSFKEEAFFTFWFALGFTILVITGHVLVARFPSMSADQKEESPQTEGGDVGHGVELKEAAKEPAEEPSSIIGHV